MKEDQILKARLKDLASKAYKQNIYTFSAFLGPAELGVLDEMKSELSFVDYETYGGSSLSERQMVRFGSEEMFGYTTPWPISVLRVEPLAEKFSETLSHRDFLGAVMNLGLDRSVIGDILVKDEKRAYLFCQETIRDFLTENLTRVKHTNVRCILLKEETEFEELAPKLSDVEAIVPSLRFDAIVAALLKCSRSEAVKYFQTGNVVLNGRVSDNNSMALKEGDVFSVRGKGKYRYCETGNETRKGKRYIHVQRYC